MLRAYLAAQRFDLLGRAQLNRCRLRAAARRADRLLNLSKFVRIASHQDHMRAERSQS